MSTTTDGATVTHGPFVSEAKGIVAYVSHSSEETLASVVFIIETSENSELIKIKSLLPSLVNNHLRDIAKRDYLHWGEVRNWVVFLQRTAEGTNEWILTIKPSASVETEPQALALSELHNVIAISSFGEGDARITMRIGAGRKGSSFQSAIVSFSDSKLESSCLNNKDVDLKSYSDELRENRPMILLQEQKIRLASAMRFAEQHIWSLAFHHFYYACTIADSDDQADVETHIEVGMYLANEMLSAGEVDFLEWVAGKVVAYSELTGKTPQIMQALQLQAIAEEGLGLLDDAMRKIERAIELLTESSDEHLRGSLHLSKATFLLQYFETYECNNEHLLGNIDDTMWRLLVEARKELNTAKKIYRRLAPKKAVFALYSIKLEEIRLLDLQGASESAIARLYALRMHKLWKSQKKTLIVTEVHYRMAAFYKLITRDSEAFFDNVDWLEQFRKLSLLITSKSFSQDAPQGRDCICLTIVGLLMISKGELTKAEQCLKLAHERHVEARQVHRRSPLVSTERQGWRSLDTCGRWLSCTVERWQALDDDATVDVTDAIEAAMLEAFLAADQERSRFFVRDLAFAFYNLPRELSVFARERWSGLRASLITRSVDERVIVADTDFECWHHPCKFAEQMAECLRAAPLAMDPEGITELFRNLPKRTTIVSFYGTDQVTFVNCLRSPGEPALQLVWNIAIDRVITITALLHSHVASPSLYRKIRAEDPSRYDSKFFTDFKTLTEGFAMIADAVVDQELVILVPHSAWHDVPMHALLLPLLWSRNASTAVVYVPSVAVLDALMRRGAAEHYLQRGNAISLMSVPAQEDNQDLFHKWHTTLEGALTQSKRPVDSIFSADIDDFFARSELCSVHHVLAHGVFDTTDPMRSGMLFSHGGRLPTKGSKDEVQRFAGFVSASSIVEHGMSAEHVSLQACSSGRVKPGPTNEFWGLARALMASGTNCVVSPMWDVDAHSSTALLSNFYRKWLCEGVPRWAAWTAVQKEMHDNPQRPEWSHFYHWAAFQMIGATAIH